MKDRPESDLRATIDAFNADPSLPAFKEGDPCCGRPVTRTLTTVAAVDPTVFYEYRVEKLPAGFDIDVFRRTRTSWLKNQACTSPTERKAMELGANYKFIYNAPDGVNLAEVTISLASCDNIGH